MVCDNIMVCDDITLSVSFYETKQNHRYLFPYQDLFQMHIPTPNRLSLSTPSPISADHPVPEGHLTVILNLN